MAKDAIEILMDDHRSAKDAFDRIMKADVDEKEELFEQLVTDLKAHVQLEKEVFYPRITQKIGNDEIRAFLEGQREEETGGTRLLEELVEMGVGDAAFDAKFRAFRDTVLKHAVEQEEKGLFPIVKQKMTGPDLQELGRAMERRQQELRRQLEAQAR
ncbi:MAG TPA: hemerythrin domain-containing protein [Candidatus Thermoplasmatota archaeon]|jgi:hemerythrin-like domain-containing protein|nr:hemerythrin domain-containing protein [Candidatus Thermoplasmatota archaeon]